MANEVDTNDNIVPLILITNDDGIDAPALLPLKQALGNVADTLVFAPDHNWSASGHPKTMHKPLRADPIFLSDGSPAFVSTAPPPDCVGLALLGIVDRPLSMVVSGINYGANLGHDVFYSGTVAAAVEATIEGVPAIAVSRERLDDDMAMAVARGYHDDSPLEEVDHRPLSDFIAKLAAKALENSLPINTFLNVNFPAVPWERIKGVELTRLGRRVYRDELVSRTDPRGRPYYWIGGQPPQGHADHGTDIWALENHLVSITPISLDMTHYRMMDELKRWQLEALIV
jgi:5'-nucleotidase